MIAVGRREGYYCRLDGDDDESESLFKSYTNVVPLRNPTFINAIAHKKLFRPFEYCFQEIMAPVWERTFASGVTPTSRPRGG